MAVSQASPTSDPPPRGKGGNEGTHHDGGHKGKKARQRGFKLGEERDPSCNISPDSAQRPRRIPNLGDIIPGLRYLVSFSRSLGGLMRPLNRLSPADADGFS